MLSDRISGVVGYLTLNAMGCLDRQTGRVFLRHVLSFVFFVFLKKINKKTRSVLFCLGLVLTWLGWLVSFWFWYGFGLNPLVLPLLCCIALGIHFHVRYNT